MRDAGAVIVDPVAIPTHDKLGDDELEVLLYEFKADLECLPARAAACRRPCTRSRT